MKKDTLVDVLQQAARHLRIAKAHVEEVPSAYNYSDSLAGELAKRAEQYDELAVRISESISPEGETRRALHPGR